MSPAPASNKENNSSSQVPPSTETLPSCPYPYLYDEPDSPPKYDYDEDEPLPQYPGPSHTEQQA
ncbi:hypothetical protein PtrSN002B_005037 [Pyrenophora tritici-repentis]|nr:hypothetical protein PtrSN001C_004634 [Pyrenophora tritici-repentis]KAI1552673.1 hypothetical protein PtrSN002B_005037 [Pyrenophora tritici-repentis]KAI1584069.1 hypothetical protein PtrEW13061_008600 [Pyrenophora tritici-repentis]